MEPPAAAPRVSPSTERPRVVIVGGGFGGLAAARALKKAAVDVALVDRRNFHLFQPLLYQVATGGLSPANIAAPLRSVLKKQRNATVMLAEAVAFDVPGRRVILADGELDYDYLVVATGARHYYFGHPEWEALAPGLKTVEDATEIRRRILLVFELAERETDPERVRELLTFVIVGGGPTGVELAGAVGEIARQTLKGEFRSIDPARARILLVEGIDRVLPPYPPQLSEKARRSLERLGVEVRTGAIVTEVSEGRLTLRSGDEDEVIGAQTVLWAAGVQASFLGDLLARAVGAEVDRAGRVLVEPALDLSGHPEIFVIGDLAQVRGGPPLPGVAPVAIQEGRHVARTIERLLRGELPEAFRYRDRGSMATIGRGAAVADLGRVRLSGFPGWMVWLFVHLLNITQFENRLLVLVQWSWNYLTRNRSARLITGAGPEREARR